MKKKSLLIVAILTFVLSFAFAACGETETPHTHEYTAYEWVEGSTPTETEAGKATATCSTCGESTTVDVPKLTDESVWTVTTTDATCTADGEKTYTSKYGTVKVAIAASHKFGDLVAATDSTCLKKGNVAYYHCTVCEKNFAEDGTTELESVEKPLADHDYGTLIAAVASTCKTHGTVAHYHCSVCEKNFDADKNELTSIEALLADHDYGELVAATESTCQVQGNIAYYHCSVCGKYFNEEKTEITEAETKKPLADHDYGELVAATESTCQTQGNIAYYHCSVCGKYFNEEKTEITEAETKKPLADHDYGEWQKGDENGHFRACKTEGCTEKETVAHDYTGQAYYPAGAEEHYVNCKVCRYEHREHHEFGEWTKKDETSHAHKCVKCNKEITEAHTGGTATCKAQAECTVCHEAYGDFAAHVLGEDGVCTVCGKIPNAVFGKTYSAFTVSATGAVDTKVNALLTFDANGKAEGVTGSVGIIKKNGQDEEPDPNGYYYDDTIGVIYSESAVYIRYVDKEKGTIQFVSSYKKATETYAGSGKYGTPKLTETTYDGYITATNGFIFIPQGNGNHIILVPIDAPVTTDLISAVAFSSKGNMYGRLFIKYTGTEAHTVYYDGAYGGGREVVTSIDATITDFDGAEVAPAAIKTAPAMIVKDKAGNVIAKYGYDGTSVIELDEWAGKYTGNLGNVTVWGNGKITTGFGDGTYVAVVADDHNIEVTYYNTDGDVTAYYEVMANKADYTYTGEMPMITISYDLGAYGESYEDDGYKKVTFTLPAAPVSNNELYMFGGWAIGDATYEAGAKVSADSNVTVTAIWKQKVQITIVDEKNAGGNNGKVFYAGSEDGIIEVLNKNVTTVLEGEEFKYYAINGQEVEAEGTVGEENLTVTVVWKEKYTLTIVYGNGLENGTETYFEGYATNPEKPAFTNGQVFDGWFTDAECTVAYTPAALTGDLTIYAKWITAAVPFVGESKGFYISYKASTWDQITGVYTNRYITVDAEGVVTDAYDNIKNKQFTYDSATNQISFDGNIGIYDANENMFVYYKYDSQNRRTTFYMYFVGATEVAKTSVNNDGYSYNYGESVFFRVVVTKNGEAKTYAIYACKDNFYFDVVVEKSTDKGATFTECTSFNSISYPDAIKVYNSDKSVLIATLIKANYTLKVVDEFAGTYTATVDGAVSEDNVVLDGVGGITFGSLTGTYELNSDKTAYDVYLNSKKVYYSMTIDKSAMTATLVKEMVTVSFDLNTVSGVDMGTFDSVSVNKNVSASLSEYKPTKSGYVFKGWYTTAELTTSASSVTPTENVTVYAKWAKLCVVSFSTAHGTAPDSYNAEQDTWVYPNNDKLEDTDDYAFYGWYVEGYENNKIITGSYKVTDDTTFIAVWKEKVTLTIKYLADETEVITAKTVKIAVDREFDLSAYKPTDEERGNYVFRSFYKEGDEAMAAITSITVADGEVTTVVAKMEAGLTLTVKYQDNKVADKAYVVGSGDTLDLSAAQAATYADGADTFFVEGIYTDETYATAFTATSITENTIVYAKWIKAGTYTVVSGGDKKGFDYNAEKGCWISNNAGVGKFFRNAYDYRCRRTYFSNVQLCLRRRRLVRTLCKQQR